MLVNDLTPHLAAQRQALLDATARVIDSGWLVLGPAVKQFEAEFAAYVGQPHAIGTANGTDALRLALKAVGVAPGEHVLMVANAGGYGSIAAHQIGAVPLYMDVELSHHLPTLACVQRALASGLRPQALILTHLYGRLVPEVVAIAQLCREQGVPLIEDCAQAHGARNAQGMAGSFGDLACFSFYPTKNLGALGDGGAVLCREEALAERLRQLRQYGWQSKYQVAFEGGENTRLDELQAAYLSIKLPLLDAYNARRRAIVNAYIHGIQHPHITLPDVLDESSVGHLAVMRSPQRDSLRAHLQAQGMGSDVHYPTPDHRQALWQAAYTSISLPNTEQLAREVISLPCYPEMTDDQVQQVVKAVNGWSAA